MEKATGLPTTEDIRKATNEAGLKAGTGDSPAEDLGEFLAPGGYIKGAKKVGKKVAGAVKETLETPPKGAITLGKKKIPDGEWINRDEFTSYANQSSALKGFKKDAPSTPFAEQKYKHFEYLEIDLGDDVFVDGIRGLNRPHAIARAFENWSDANRIKILSREQAEKADPNLVRGVESVMKKPEAK